MSKRTLIINKRNIQNLTEPGLYRDSKLQGFCLRVRAKTKVYLVIRKIRGEQTNVTVTIGRDGVITPDQARDRARVIIADLAAGKNPNETFREALREKKNKEQEQQRKQEIDGITFAKAFGDFIETRPLKPNTKYVYKAVVNRYLADWSDLPLTAITKDMVEQRHRDLSDHKAQANHVLRIARAVFNFAMIAYDRHDGLPLLSENPVRRLSQLRAWHRIPRRQTVIKMYQMRKWYNAVCNMEDRLVADYLLFLILTGLRKSEAAHLTWSTVDFHAQTVTILDTKNGEDHCLPLTPQLLAILCRRAEAAHNEFVFCRPGSQNGMYDCRLAIKQVIEESGVKFSLHDLRRTFITAAEMLDIPYYCLKRLANHKTNDDVTSGYIIADVERLREPMEKITEFFLRKFQGIETTIAAHIRS